MRGAALAGALLVFCASATARADDANAIAAEALFVEARTLSRDGRYAEACPKYAQSMKLDPAAGTALNLAECDVAIGKSASAWLAYREAITLARRSGEKEREAFAQERAKALEPKLCRMTIAVAPANQTLSDLTVMRGPEALERAAWGIPVPVDPGRYVVEAKAAGHSSFSRTLQVAASEGPCATIEVDVPVLAVIAAPPAIAPAAADHPATGWRGAHTLAVGLGVAGLGVLVASGAFALHARSENSDGEAECSPASCPPDGEAKIVSAGHSADVATGLFVAGAALIAAGVVTWIVSPPLHGGAPRAVRTSLLTF